MLGARRPAAAGPAAARRLATTPARTRAVVLACPAALALRARRRARAALGARPVGDARRAARRRCPRSASRCRERAAGAVAAALLAGGLAARPARPRAAARGAALGGAACLALAPWFGLPYAVPAAARPRSRSSTGPTAAGARCWRFLGARGRRRVAPSRWPASSSPSPSALGDPLTVLRRVSRGADPRSSRSSAPTCSSARGARTAVARDPGAARRRGRGALTGLDRGSASSPSLRARRRRAPASRSPPPSALGPAARAPRTGALLARRSPSPCSRPGRR